MSRNWRCTTLALVLVGCVLASQYGPVFAAQGGLRSNDNSAPRITEQTPCKENCAPSSTTTVVETTEPLGGPFMGKVQVPAKSNVLIAEGENATDVKESHSKMISEHKGFEVSGVQFVQNYNSDKSHPNGGYVGSKYVEWVEPKVNATAPTTFVPPTVPTGYYSHLKAQAEEISRTQQVHQLRQERAKRRTHICEICDSAVETGRVIVKNEAKRGVYSEFGLATFTSVICKNLRDGFPEELPHFECEGLRKHIVSYYDKKYMHEIEGHVERYTADGTVFEKKLPGKKVNAALASALQNCKTLMGIDFCDGTPACGTCNGACPCEQKKAVVHEQTVAVTEHKPACGTCNGACPCKDESQPVVSRTKRHRG